MTTINPIKIFIEWKDELIEDFTDWFNVLFLLALFFLIIARPVELIYLIIKQFHITLDPSKINKIGVIERFDNPNIVHYIPSSRS